MKVLLTGADGFIGKAVAKALSNKGIKYVAIDRSFFDTDNTPGEMQDDISLLMHDVDVVIHLGAMSNTLSTNVNEVMMFNYLISKMIFDCASTNHAKVVFASSASVYGSDDEVPNNLYAWSKLVAEDYGVNKGGLLFISLRYFNCYGNGEEHKGKMASIAYQAYQQYYKNSKRFRLFKGSPRRDFIYIDDVVQATIHALLNVLPPGCYDVGTGTSHTFEQVLEHLKIPFDYYENEDIVPEGYQWYTCADKSFRLPGWLPKYSLEQGLMQYKDYLENA